MSSRDRQRSAKNDDDAFQMRVRDMVTRPCLECRDDSQRYTGAPMLLVFSLSYRQSRHDALSLSTLQDT